MHVDVVTSISPLQEIPSGWLSSLANGLQRHSTMDLSAFLFESFNISAVSWVFEPSAAVTIGKFSRTFLTSPASHFSPDLNLIWCSVAQRCWLEGKLAGTSQFFDCRWFERKLHGWVTLLLLVVTYHLITRQLGDSLMSLFCQCFFPKA